MYFLSYFLYFCFGLIIGSFLNVCIYRIPRNISIVKPRSFCPKCHKMIEWYNNIPVISWILLKGKSFCCNERISIKYPFIELLTGILFVICAIKFPFPQTLAWMILMSLLICASFIDYDWQIIPDSITLGGMFFGLITSCLFPEIHLENTISSSIIESLKGVLISSGILLWIGFISESLLKKETIGFGDVKLVGFLGAFLGWESGIFVIFLGAFLGSSFFLIHCLFYKINISIKKFTNIKKLDLKSKIPFGPFISLASIIYVFYAQNIFKSYIKNIWICLNF